jgi:hypothetical protein
MKVLLTGGSGNLGQTLVPKLLGKGDTPLLLDVRAPPLLNEGAVFIEGSVLDRSGARWRCPWAGDGRWSIPRPAAWGVMGAFGSRGRQNTLTNFWQCFTRGAASFRHTGSAPSPTRVHASLANSASLPRSTVNV